MSSQPQTTICVFCGSSPGNNPAHMQAARSLAQTFAKNNIKLIYGGGTSGLMGELARTLVSLSGPNSVHGIIPGALLPLEAAKKVLEDSEAASNGASGETAAPKIESNTTKPPEEIYGVTTIVPDMHTRKRTMADLVLRGGEGSGFIALSGGYGTLEELMEIVTWNQLGIHERGICLFNVDGYWDGIVEWVTKAASAGFIREGNSEILVQGTDAEMCVRKLKEYSVARGRFELSWDVEGSP